MKKQILGAVTAILLGLQTQPLVAACSKGETTVMSKSSTINGNWIVTEAEGIHVNDGQMRLEIFDGSVFGQAPCNSFNAQLMSSDGGFNLGPLDVRGNICDEAAMNDEQTYLRMLNRLSHFEIDADGALILSSFGAPMIKAVPEEN